MENDFQLLSSKLKIQNKVSKWKLANYKLVLSQKYPNTKTMHKVIIQGNN